MVYADAPTLEPGPFDLPYIRDLLEDGLYMMDVLADHGLKLPEGVDISMTLDEGFEPVRASLLFEPAG